MRKADKKQILRQKAQGILFLLSYFHFWNRKWNNQAEILLYNFQKTIVLCSLFIIISYMSNSLNKVQVIWNLTAEPEVRETPNGQKVATFSVATNRRWKDASGVMQEDTEFHNCVAWRGLADIAEQYMHKWKKVYIEGYLKTRSWDDTAGVKRYKTEIVSENVILLSSASGQDGGSYGSSAATTATESVQYDEEKPRKAKPKVEEDISIEDIPF